LVKWGGAYIHLVHVQILQIHEPFNHPIRQFS
jgi:hypothetical protein